ncbi:hypothetical protein GOZ83_19955 [Agrobacterium vitis]|uniref:head-tail connector protein n=1 Tax=Agrobacterium vitis TaxID=373 RepID=UPI0012E8D4BB|nr:phage head-tail connector protein [Agrobacterium vitis]MVA47332.1 hypothetical protein [Agrobacterium vitis]
MLVPKRIIAPTASILTLSEIKEHLRVEQDDDAENDLLEALISVAETYLDGYSGVLGRCMITQTWRYSLYGWPSCRLDLPFPDVASVTVRYRDDDDQEQTLPDSQYQLLEGAGGSFVRWFDSFSGPSLYDRGDAVQVDMVCGYGDTADAVPANIIHAAKLMIGAWYENRENVVVSNLISQLPISVSAQALLATVRRVGV